VPLGAEVGVPELFDVVDVVPERCEPQPLVRAGCLPYAFLRALQVLGWAALVCFCGFPFRARLGVSIPFPSLTLCSGPVLQNRIAFGQFPFLHLLRRPGRTAVFVRGLLRYYGTVRLPATVRCRRAC
jgi:hypothetical protein